MNGVAGKLGITTDVLVDTSMLLHHPPWATFRLDWFHHVGLLSDSFTLDPSRRLRRAAPAVCFWLPVVLVVVLATAPLAVLASLLTADTGGPPGRAAPRGLLLAARRRAASVIIMPLNQINACRTWGQVYKGQMHLTMQYDTARRWTMAVGNSKKAQSAPHARGRGSPMGAAARSPRSGGAEKILAVRMLSLLMRRAWSNARSSPKVISAA